MEEAPLLGEMSGPEDEMVPDLFGAESRFVSESMPLKAPAVLKAGQDEFPAFKDPYLSAADPKEPLLRALAPPLGADLESKVQAELLADAGEAAILAAFPGLPELDPLEDAALPAPPAYNVHLLSSLLAPHRSPAVVPLGAWALEGAAHAGVRVIPVRPVGSRRGAPRPSPRRGGGLRARTWGPSRSVSPASGASRVGVPAAKQGAPPGKPGRSGRRSRSPRGAAGRGPRGSLA